MSISGTPVTLLRRRAIVVMVDKVRFRIVVSRAWSAETGARSALPGSSYSGWGKAHGEG